MHKLGLNSYSPKRYEMIRVLQPKKMAWIKLIMTTRLSGKTLRCLAGFNTKKNASNKYSGYISDPKPPRIPEESVLQFLLAKNSILRCQLLVFRECNLIEPK